MNWNTIYITSNDDFWEAVNKKLSNSDLNYLTGFMEQRPDNKFHGLYWIDNTIELKRLKEAIGAKLIWKYRLEFFNELDQSGNSIPAQEGIRARFSEKENSMIKAMRQKAL